MRAILFTQRIGAAILLANVFLRFKFPLPTARAAVIVRGGSTPFLIGPPPSVVSPTTNANEDNNSNDNDTPTTTATSAPTTTLAAKFATAPITSSQPNDASTASASTSHSDDSNSPTSTTSSSPISQDPTPAPLAPAADANSKQLASIKYLVPVFLLILLTLFAWAYSRWYARRKRREGDKDLYVEAEAEKARNATDSSRGQWRKLDGADSDAYEYEYGNGYDEKDPWYARTSEQEGQAQEVTWQDVELVSAQSNGAISVAGRGWGWKSTMNVWKSARGKDLALDAEEIDELGQRRTITMLQQQQQMRNSHTYQTLPDLEGKPADPQYREERGSLRALRDKLTSLSSYKDIVAGFGLGNRLDRNRLPNKRRTRENVYQSPPEPPAWIQPRATSPTQTQILSPPMQPHLFFHPTPSALSLHALRDVVNMSRTTTGSESESGSEYSEVDSRTTGSGRSDHARFPTIPSTADALASTYTAVPRRTPRKQGQGRSRSGESTELVVDGPDGNENDSQITPKPRRSQLKRLGTTPTPSARSTKRAELQTPITLRRSTAKSDLAAQSPTATSKISRRSTTKDRSRTTTTASTISRPTSPRKSRSVRKAEKAHDKVEDILKASWSDRALASPTSMSIDGMVASAATKHDVGSSGPGVESAAVMSGTGGGIEQRLAILRSMDV